MSVLQGQKVWVLGLGESGLAMVRWCLSQGAQVRVADTRTEHPQVALLEQLTGHAVHLGGFDGLDDAQLQALLHDSSALYKSQGLSPRDPAIAPLLAMAQEMKITVAGELQLFEQALQQLKASQNYTPRVLAITGTNGKTTVTRLTHLLISEAGKSARVAGNISPSLLDALMHDLAHHSLPEVWVIELASFQLDQALTFNPDAATVLNVTQDHLDWHVDMDDYAASKAFIFGEHTLRVLNRDDERVMRMLPQVFKNTQDEWRRTQALWISFGWSAPTRPGDYGVILENGMQWMVRALPDDETVKRKPGEDIDVHLQRLMPVEALRIQGRHNALNALAALALASSVGCTLAPMLHALREYRGEPHRLSFVQVVAGVEYIDDSKGTNVGATVAAIQGLGANMATGKLVVILGGDGKGQDFTPLIAPVLTHARAVVTLGKDAAVIEGVLAAGLTAQDIPWQRVRNMQDAVACSADFSRSGDKVLLSPACASLDMFKNYVDRAEQFVDAVQALALEKGEVI